MSATLTNIDFSTIADRLIAEVIARAEEFRPGTEVILIGHIVDGRGQSLKPERTSLTAGLSPSGRAVATQQVIDLLIGYFDRVVRQTSQGPLALTEDRPPARVVDYSLEMLHTPQ
jgi:hypothetical protein